jgi:hypothetical protein
MKVGIILSVPFQRQNRVLLGPHVLEVLKEAGDLIIITPSAEDPNFINSFGLGNTILVNSSPLRQNKFGLFLYHISEIFRMNGFWEKNRSIGMAYYLKMNEFKLDPNGNDKRKSFFLRAVFNFLSKLGVNPKLWKAIDKLIGWFVYETKIIENTISKYESILLIQSASWGEQDRMLAWLGEKKKWKTTLLPYTTDQLFCNGFLMSDFNSVCVQGPREEEFAKHFHGLQKNKIVHLGSTWFRHIDLIEKNIKRDNSSQLFKLKKILYAGSFSLYFPIESEFAGLDKLIEAVRNQIIPDALIIYRPFGETEEMRNLILERYSNNPFVIIQFAQKACYALETSANELQNGELMEYISQMLDIDILIMCFASTLSLDVSHLGIPAISNFYDPTGILKRRSVDLLFDTNGRVPGIEHIPVCHDIQELINRTAELISNPRASQLQAKLTDEQWDYPEVDFQKTLRHTIEKLTSD